jgi:hypothetical protein
LRTFTTNVENGTLTTDYGGKHPIAADVVVGGRVWNALSVSVGVSYATQRADAAISALVPHPFVFNAPRSVSGVASGIVKDELAVHVDAGWTMPAAGPLRITLFGGPSIFHLRQGLVTGVSVQESYPYDTATFGSATVTEAKGTRVGGNGGFDLSVQFSKYVGVGAIGRYSRATVKLPAGDDPGVDMKVGGFQMGAGLRFRF